LVPAASFIVRVHCVLLLAVRWGQNVPKATADPSFAFLPLAPLHIRGNRGRMTKCVTYIIPVADHKQHKNQLRRPIIEDIGAR
jgi:hypothetical protein